MTTPNEHPHEEYGEERSPWSKPSVLLSGMFVLALLLGGIAYVIFNGGSSPSHHAQVSTPSSTGSAATRAASTAKPSPTGCTLPAGSQSVPYSSPPAGTQWAQVGSMNVPQAPETLGPQHTNGIWNTCFAHSPAGALLAAINFWAEGTTNTPREVLARLAVGVRGPIQDNTTLDQDFHGPPQVAGYRYQSYIADEAHVVTALRAPNGNYESLDTVMRWTGNDWRFVAPTSGIESYETFADLPAGYVQWSGF